MMIGYEWMLTQSVNKEVLHKGGKGSRFDGTVVVHLNLLLTIIRP